MNGENSLCSMDYLDFAGVCRKIELFNRQRFSIVELFALSSGLL